MSLATRVERATATAQAGRGTPTASPRRASIARLAADTLLPWRNPAFRRFIRSRLRLRKAVFWYLLTLIVTTFVIALAYTLGTKARAPAEDVARGLWIPLLVIQGLILMVKGTGSVSAGLIQDRIDQTLDYQRLTPASPLRNLVGYLFGLPILEYAMFALTLPHLAFITVVGRIPAGTLLSVYCSFFVCAMLYHMTGITAGMVMRRWVAGYMLSTLLVLGVNAVLPSLVSQLGLSFFQYLSVWPVIGQEVLPLLSSWQTGAGGDPFITRFNDVPFYGWRLSPFVFALLLQGTLILTFGVMAVRRWKSATRHSLSKPFALAFLTGFIVVLIGNVWPIVTRQAQPVSLFGAGNFDDLGEIIVTGLPLVYSYVVWMLCFVLFAIIVPSHDHVVRGMRRALKQGRAKVPTWDDDSASLRVYALFTAVAFIGLFVLLRAISAAEFPLPNALPMWRSMLSLALVVFYTALLFQALGVRPAMLVVLLLWCLPVLIAIVLAARAGGLGHSHAIVAGLSPLALPFLSDMHAGDVGTGGADALSPFIVGANTGFAAVVLQIILLALLWRYRPQSSFARAIR